MAGVAPSPEVHPLPFLPTSLSPHHREPRGKGLHVSNASKPSISPHSPPQGWKFHYMSREGSPFFVSGHLAPETSELKPQTHYCHLLFPLLVYDPPALPALPPLHTDPSGPASLSQFSFP